MPTKEELEIATYIAETLLRKYPGYPWAVQVNGEGGIATIQLDFTGKWAFVLHLKALEHDLELKSVMRAGGELLERYKLRRGAADDAQIFNMPVNFSGLPQPAL
jgi:hypothetical protein